MALQAKRSSTRLGVGVIVVRDGNVLFGQRRGAHGAGTWSFPGGHVDGGETAEACALRELREEAGVEAANAAWSPRRPTTSPRACATGRCSCAPTGPAASPLVREPDRCARWGWFSWDDPPAPLFLPVASLRASGFRP